ncbi:hypothetical protein QFC20_006994 [Naganishia adeliensis]|uniref:Uncharacterized protein n=1 Tax=Naganishia adeliensis TaxID=92952 RepID=A0ACC2V3U7_9TREE|nr:hypothetical protein QFC20_006994 [Naganishia adeliensis]
MTMNVGPNQTLAQVFEEETGLKLPEGCTLAVTSFKAYEAVKPSVRGAIVFVHTPKSWETSLPGEGLENEREEGVPPILAALAIPGVAVGAHAMNAVSYAMQPERTLE